MCARTSVTSLSHSCRVAWLRLLASYSPERPGVSSWHVECKRKSGSYVAPASCFLPWCVLISFRILAFYSQPVESCTEYMGLLAPLVFLGQLILQTQQFPCAKSNLTALNTVTFHSVVGGWWWENVANLYCKYLFEENRSMLCHGNSNWNINVSHQFCFEGLDSSALYGTQGSSSSAELRQILEGGKYSFLL